MKFIKSFCFIILIHTVLGYTAQANVAIYKVDIISVQSTMQEKKPKNSERKKVVIEISKEVGYILISIAEVIIDVCENTSSCSLLHN